MSLNNIPNLPIAITSPINTINRRQRSNTSPTQSLSALRAEPANDALLPHPSAPTPDHYYELPQLTREGGRQDEQRHEQQILSGNNGNPTNPLSSSLSHHTRSLKREANSPVYLDHNTISLASSNNHSYFFGPDNNTYLTRRVVQCNSDRIRSSDSDVTSISSQDETFNFQRKSKVNNSRVVSTKNRKKTHGQRNKWTTEETQALVRGCNNFAIGQWKAIRDSEPELSKRSPGDLKDRFRTYFPDAYRKHYPNAKTHISSRVRSVDSNGNPLFGENAVRRERKQFSAEEDAALKRGYIKFGTAWSSIQRDPILASRKATDLRDRFRNAFPDLYIAAGYKPRSRKASGSNVLDFLADPNEQHGTFEAIDLSVYPPHPSRATSHLHPNQYQLPSLDFLKAHGADAFSDFGMMLSNPEVSVGDDAGSQDHPQLMLAATLGPALPPHLTNMTPRPNITTPRPNDTTPRPRKIVASTTTEELDAASVGSSEKAFHPLVSVPTKAPCKTLHKTQSSMDLTQLSNLHLVDSNFNFTAMPHQMHAAGMYSPTSTDYLDYGGISTGQFPESQFFQSLASKLSLQPGSNHVETGGNFGITESPTLGQFEHDFGAGTTMNDTTDWLRELDVGPQTFPGGFDISGFVNEKIFESPDGGSCGSSLISPDPSKESIDDRVVYTGDGNNFLPSPPAGHSFTSQQSLSPHRSQLHLMSMSSPQAQELFLNGHFIENTHHSTHELPNQETSMNLDRSNLHPAQLEQPGHLYQHHHGHLMNSEHLNQITLCPSLMTSDLNSPLPCSPTSPASASSAINPPSSTSPLSLISSPMSNQLDLLNM
ncbi:hypothetical protein PGT21_011832 [Puccinia graminis f. sp. tritici]|uniref:Myb-like domain-containing protein n=1 Tax=Puccinia graminis f. sp. tritici TaxID=56615 RepID=A0A5B0PU91_PUCGR|nr:hypothetical protein PGT21_011832 [Puccinia graminis f. sp. tritici]